MKSDPLLCPEKPVECGDGATIHVGSDSYACTVVKVTRAQIHVKQDISVLVEGSRATEKQKYEYISDPNKPVQVFRKTKRGWRDTSGRLLSVGVRHTYIDPNF